MASMPDHMGDWRAPWIICSARPVSLRNSSTASPRRLCASASSRRSVYSARSLVPPSYTAYGTSYTATRRTGSPLAAACSASAPPDEMPYSAASPPSSSISAARSSTSRSTA